MACSGRRNQRQSFDPEVPGRQQNYLAHWLMARLQGAISGERKSGASRIATFWLLPLFDGTVCGEW